MLDLVDSLSIYLFQGMKLRGVVRRLDDGYKAIIADRFAVFRLLGLENADEACGYDGAYQLGHISTVWDPFFPGGTKAVLESDVSRAWPISDAGLGAISYILEALTGFWGGTRRWRTMPWLVIVFGILVVPLGVTSIVLIILQPLAVGAWCTLCLITAAAMLIMIAPALDEVIATCQFLARSRREGQPFWRTFFHGGTVAEIREPTHVRRRQSVVAELIHASGLDNIPWNLTLCAGIGTWLMFAPSVLGTIGSRQIAIILSAPWSSHSQSLPGARSRVRLGSRIFFSAPGLCSPLVSERRDTRCVLE